MMVTVAEAVSLLERGKVVAIPTETVYGLAADAQSDEALTLLYQSKGRPSDHPVILHVADLEMCRPFVADLPEAAVALMEAFWPGPLTLLLPKSDLVSPRITGGRPLVGVRAPASPLTQQLLHELGRPVVAPSANRFGHISPTSALHVEEEFEGRIPVLDGGPCQVGLESTIVSLEGGTVVVLRPGQLSLKRMEEVSGLPVVLPDRPVQGVPGALKSHYAPRQPVSLLPIAQLELQMGEDTAILVFTTDFEGPAALIRPMPTNAADYGRELYSALRQAEATGCARILIELPPEDASWSAIHDRLSRAAAR